MIVELSRAAQNDEIPYGGKILIVLNGALGDVARGLVVPSTLKEARPDLHIVWLVEDKWRTIVDLCPAVDSVVEFSRSSFGGLSTFLALRALQGEIRRAGPYNLTLDLQRHFRSGVFSFLSGAPIRVGFHRKNAKEGNWIFNNRSIPVVDDSVSKVHHYLEFSRLFGASSSKDVRFQFDRERCVKAAAPLLEGLRRPFLVCVLGSSWDSKNWVVEGYLEYIREAQRNFRVPVLLTGDKSQVEVASEITRQLPRTKDPVVNLVAQTDLVQLCGVLLSASLAVGPDTGPGHLASLVETPYLGLFGPTDPKRVAPFRSEDLALTSPVPCSPCWRRVCPGLGKVCMRLQSVSEMIRITERVLRARPFPIVAG